MFFSQLLKANQTLSSEELNAADQYFYNLTPTASEHISLSRFCSATKIPQELSEKFFKECLTIGFLKKQFICRCPECGLLLKEVHSLNDIQKPLFCDYCEEEQEISLDDIEVSYSINVSYIPFEVGRQISNAGDGNIAFAVQHPTEPNKSIELIDGLPYQFECGLAKYSDLYCPTNEQYQTLKDKLQYLTENHSTSTEHGSSLEEFIAYWFNLCKCFKASTKLRTNTNQIDCTVRNFLHTGFLSNIGTIFYCECKNEKSTPKGDYLSKLHSIIHTSSTTFGIFISATPAPKTFKSLAYKAFLRDKIVIIWFDLKEIKTIIFNKSNLLEIIERKYVEITTGSVSDLVSIGLYDC